MDRLFSKDLEMSKVADERKRVEAELIVVTTMKKLGAISGDLTFRQACRIYGTWFKDAVEMRRILPTRLGRGARCTKWYSVESILAVKAEELENAEIILRK